MFQINPARTCEILTGMVIESFYSPKVNAETGEINGRVFAKMIWRGRVVTCMQAGNARYPVSRDDVLEPGSPIVFECRWVSDDQNLLAGTFYPDGVTISVAGSGSSLLQPFSSPKKAV